MTAPALPDVCAICGEPADAEARLDVIDGGDTVHVSCADVSSDVLRCTVCDERVMDERAFQLGWRTIHGDHYCAEHAEAAAAEAESERIAEIPRCEWENLGTYVNVYERMAANKNVGKPDAARVALASMVGRALGDADMKQAVSIMEWLACARAFLRDCDDPRADALLEAMGQEWVPPKKSPVAALGALIAEVKS
jgi:hypothetical protein